jgi:hypothetical protein
MDVGDIDEEDDNDVELGNGTIAVEVDTELICEVPGLC